MTGPQPYRGRWDKCDILPGFDQNGMPGRDGQAASRPGPPPGATPTRTRRPGPSLTSCSPAVTARRSRSASRARSPSARPASGPRWAPGPMRMNRLVAARVAAGLARYITARDPAAAAAGIVDRLRRPGQAPRCSPPTPPGSCPGPASASSLLPGPLPTPVLAFSVRHLRRRLRPDGDGQPQPAPGQRDQGLRAGRRAAAAAGRRGHRRRHRRGGPAAPARGLGRGAVRVHAGRRAPCAPT